MNLNGLNDSKSTKGGGCNMDRNVRVFESSQEAMDAIRTIMERGFKGREFTVIAKNEEDISFTNHDEYVDVKAITIHDEEEDSFIDKAMRFFKDVEGSLEEHLTVSGVSEEDARRYENEIEAGKIVVLVKGGEEQK
jgi:hypothetical protein